MVNRVLRNIFRTCILLAGLLPRSFAQHNDLAFQQLSTGHGLSHPVTTSIVQDSTGFLWVGTADGLNRYDGFQFTVFKPVPKDSTSLSHNEVTCLFVDRSGILWVGTALGLNKYDPLTERFKRVRSVGALKFSGSHINTIMQDAAGIFWLGTTAGLSGFDEATGTILNFKTNTRDDNSLSDNNVLSIVEDDELFLWIGTHKGLNRLDRDRKTFKRFLREPRGPKNPGSETINAIYVDKKGLLWTGTSEGLDVLERKGAHPVLLASIGLPHLSHSMIVDILEDKFGNIWLATAGGGLNMVPSENVDSLRREFTKTVRVVQHRHVPLNTRSLHNDFVRALFEDASGSLWACTNDGLSKSDNEQVRFRLYQRDPRKPLGLKANFVTSIVEDRKGKVWIGTSDDLNNIPVGSEEVGYTVLGQNGPPDLTDISAVHEDTGGVLWIATWKGLNRFDSKTNSLSKFTHDPNDPFSISSDVVISIGEDAMGGIWFGTYGGGLNHFDRTTGRFTRYLHDPADSFSISNNTIFSVFRDRFGRMWFGTKDGLSHLDAGEGASRRFHREPENSTGFRGKAVGAIMEDGNTLWVGTSDGLSRIALTSSAHPTVETERVYTKQDGLPGNEILSLVLDDDKNVWIATSGGIARLNPLTDRVRVFGPEEGFNIGMPSRLAACKTRNGELFFGGFNGLIRFHPVNLKDNSYVPPVVITSFLKFNRRVTFDTSITYLKTVILNHSDQVFSLRFAGFSFLQQQRNQYAYMMQGFDSGWVYCGGNHEATYTNLDPGHYVFRAKGSNNDAIWNESGASLQVTILPPYWQTWWFRMIVIACIVALIYSAYRYRLAKLLEVERLRLRIASDLHDDIGSNLSSIALSSRLMLRDESLSTQIRTQLDRIANTARHTADSMKDVVWMINPENDDLDDMLLRMKDIAANLLQDMTYTFNTPTDQNTGSIGLEIKRNVFLVYKESLNNIVKHSRATNVAIEVTHTANTMVITIRDNGVGFDVQTATTGNGLRNLRRRIGAVDGTLSVASEPGKGTVVTVSFSSRKGVMEKG